MGAGSYHHVPGALRVGRVVAGVVWGADLPLQLQALLQSYVHFTSCKYRHSKPCSLPAQPQPREAMYPAHWRREGTLNPDAKGDWGALPSPFKQPFLPSNTFSLLLLSREVQE